MVLMFRGVLARSMGKKRVEERLGYGEAAKRAPTWGDHEGYAAGHWVPRVAPPRLGDNPRIHRPRQIRGRGRRLDLLEQFGLLGLELFRGDGAGAH